jgi:hypothetical protein
MDSYIVTLPGIEDGEGAQQAVANLKKTVLGFEARRKSDPSKVDASTMLIDVRNAANLFRAGEEITPYHSTSPRLFNNIPV